MGWDYCRVPSCGEKCAGQAIKKQCVDVTINGKKFLKTQCIKEKSAGQAIKKQCIDVTINGKKFLKTQCIKGGANLKTGVHGNLWCATKAPYNKWNGWAWNCRDC